jgi:hypothetical protein
MSASVLTVDDESAAGWERFAIADAFDMIERSGRGAWLDRERFCARLPFLKKMR